MHGGVGPWLPRASRCKCQDSFVRLDGEEEDMDQVRSARSPTYITSQSGSYAITSSTKKEALHCAVVGV